MVWELVGGFVFEMVLGGFMIGLNVFFCFIVGIMFGGKVNIFVLLFGGMLFGVGGNDGDCGIFGIKCDVIRLMN